MSPSRLPLDDLPAWAVLNGTDLSHVRVRRIEGKGCGLVARHDIPDCQATAGRAGGGADGGGSDFEAAANLRAILRIPHDCVLSAETVEGCAKINQNLRQLLDGSGYQTAKSKITLFLLTQIVLSKRSHSAPGGAPLTPWTEYVKFLPDHVPLPTMWSVEERQWLVGTSLESALRAKLSVLVDEFFELRKKSSELPFWHAFFWEDESATLGDWILADALYRSRCLELPSTAEVMVPVLDMANHSHAPVAYYDEDANGDVILSTLSGYAAEAGQEITISYGAKPAAEMLFSYGFVDENAPSSLRLPLDPLPEDPLAKAKLRVLPNAPAVRLWQEGDEFKWESPSAYLFCLNEEDGLDFAILQHTSGEREPRVFWQGDDVTDQAAEFERLAQHHPLNPVFKLRVVVTLLGRVALQLARLDSGAAGSEASDGDSRDQDGPSLRLSEFEQASSTSSDRFEAAELLRKIEAGVMRGVMDQLESEKAALLADADVLAYLESMEGVQHETLAREDVAATSEDEDFS